MLKKLNFNIALPIIKYKDCKSMFGMTIMDGNFCSLIPRGNIDGEFILSHVSESVIETEILNQNQTLSHLTELVRKK